MGAERLQADRLVHTPVMISEVLNFLKPEAGDIIVDCTVGCAGHSRKILERIAPKGRLIGIDKDEGALKIARQNLGSFAGSCILVRADFKDIQQLLKRLNIDSIDGLLFDLGVSSYQLADPDRGFSFTRDGPLDMRMDTSSEIRACDLVNSLSESEISNILLEFAEEKWHKRIASGLVKARRLRPVTTTGMLTKIVLESVPKSAIRGKIHPATRTFQALRIAVNGELEALEEALDKDARLLKPGGRLCVISFHSLEDRIVKRVFKKFSSEHILQIVTKKPITPSREEILSNPRARSAKLRVAVKK